MKNTLFYIILFLGLISCDPVQILEIENDTPEIAVISFYFKGENYYKFQDLIESDSLHLKLAPNETKFYDFGIGTWKINNSLDSLVSRIEKVKIVNHKSIIIYDSSEQIHVFLEERIDDNRYGDKITIKLGEL